MFVSVCVCVCVCGVWEDGQPEKSAVHLKLRERSLNLLPLHTPTPHLHNPEEREPCEEEGS